MLTVGQVVGPYRISGRLGAGAMGVVWEAEHQGEGRRVALKVLHKELSESPEVLRRFFNEARAMSAIGNAHVAKVSDFGQTEGGEHFMVMEALAGASLGDLLAAEKKLALGRAMHVAAQLADGLAAAHAAGVVHRDLKPDNVFLVREGGVPDFVKILDFGLAKLIFDAKVGPTQRGMVLGTPEYMSPEQAESKKTIDHRADVYALGILLYQMTTGLLPFVGPTMGDVLVKHVSRAPAPPRNLEPAMSPELEAVILRCLAKRPEDRFQSMHDVRAALRAALGQPAADVHPTAPRVSGIMAPSAGVPGPRLGAELPAPTPAAPAQRTTLIGTAVGRDKGGTGTTPPLGEAAVVASFAGEGGAAAGAARGGRGGRAWTIAAALAAGAALAGVAVWWGGRGGGGSAGGGEAAAEAPKVAAAAPAAAAKPADAALPATVTVSVATHPEGAEVFDARGTRLGVTPVDLELPRGSGEHWLILKHPGCGEKRKAVATDADAQLSIDLERLKQEE